VERRVEIAPPPGAILTLGLISDTHGLLRPQVHGLFAGVDAILHAGDVGGEEVLDELLLIAPTHAVHGNTDPPDHPRLASALVVTAAGVSIRVTHGHELGSPTPARLLERYAEQVIVFGHTHRPLVTQVAGRTVVNPGAAGARRFDLEPSVARLRIDRPHVEVELLAIA
jgi:putative phosphoesterase